VGERDGVAAFGVIDDVLEDVRRELVFWIVVTPDELFLDFFRNWRRPRR
jgi:hypothetical protein